MTRFEVNRFFDTLWADIYPYWSDFANWFDLRYLVVFFSILFVMPLLHVLYNMLRGVHYYENPAFKGRFGRGAK